MVLYPASVSLPSHVRDAHYSHSPRLHLILLTGLSARQALSRDQGTGGVRTRRQASLLGVQHRGRGPSSLRINRTGDPTMIVTNRLTEPWTLDHRFQNVCTTIYSE